MEVLQDLGDDDEIVLRKGRRQGFRRIEVPMMMYCPILRPLVSLKPNVSTGHGSCWRRSIESGEGPMSRNRRAPGGRARSQSSRRKRGA